MPLKPLHLHLLAATLLTAGCASNPPATTDATAEPGKTPYADLVAHPERLKPSAKAPDALVWEEPGLQLGRYRSIALERIRVALAGEASATPIDPAELSQLTGYFQDAIAKALGKEYPLVKQAGPGVLQLRIVIFELVPTSVTTSVAVFFTPYAMVPDIASGAAGDGGAGASPYLGRTGIAVQFIDGASGKVVGEYVETKFGKKYVVDASQGAAAAVTTGISNYTKAFSAWDYARQAFDAWALQFRQRLDASRGVAAKK